MFFPRICLTFWFVFKNEVLPISELFDMAANPVRLLLNPEASSYDQQQREHRKKLLEQKVEKETKRTPLSTQDLMVLNERSMLLTKYHEQDNSDDEATKRTTKENVIIVTGRTVLPTINAYVICICHFKLQKVSTKFS